MTVWSVPIEPVPQRYSSDWRRWFREEWPDSKWIDGEALTDKIESGSFLDVVGTNFYKASQVQKIARLIREKQIRDGDVLFFHDLWFPLEQVFYMLDGLRLDVKVVGYLHAGSYDVNDFLHHQGMDVWASEVEAGWFKRVDKILVMSDYHRQVLVQRRAVDVSKVFLVDFPYRWGELDKYRTRNWEDRMWDVVFPHNPARKEKSPELLEAMLDAGLSVAVPHRMCRTKEEYFKMVADARYAVSWNWQETYGIAMAEANRLGCIPLVPNRLCYPELYVPSVVCRSIEQMVEVVCHKEVPKGKTDIGWMTKQNEMGFAEALLVAERL